MRVLEIVTNRKWWILTARNLGNIISVGVPTGALGISGRIIYTWPMLLRRKGAVRRQGAAERSLRGARRSSRHWHHRGTGSRLLGSKLLKINVGWGKWSYWINCRFAQQALSYFIAGRWNPESGWRKLLLVCNWTSFKFPSSLLSSLLSVISSKFMYWHFLPIFLRPYFGKAMQDTPSHWNISVLCIPSLSLTPYGCYNHTFTDEEVWSPKILGLDENTYWNFCWSPMLDGLDSDNLYQKVWHV